MLNNKHHSTIFSTLKNIINNIYIYNIIIIVILKSIPRNILICNQRLIEGTLAASGLGGLKAALAEEEKPSHSNIPNNAVYDRDSFFPYDRNYE